MKKILIASLTFILFRQVHNQTFNGESEISTLLARQWKNGSQSNQKIQYLERLFEAVEKEQSTLPTNCTNKGSGKEAKEIYQEL